MSTAAARRWGRPTCLADASRGGHTHGQLRLLMLGGVQMSILGNIISAIFHHSPSAAAAATPAASGAAAPGTPPPQPSSGPAPAAGPTSAPAAAPAASVDVTGIMDNLAGRSSEK